MALRTVATPFKAFGSWYLASAKKHPFATAFWTSGIKTAAADLIAQKVVEKREKLDWTRHIGFAAFGFLYLGCIQYYLYNVKFVQWCGGITEQVGHAGTAPLKTLMDQGIHHPFIYFPTFWLVQGLVQQQPNPFMYTWHKWNNEIWESCKALWTLWVPGQIINFAVVPRHLRVPFGGVPILGRITGLLVVSAIGLPAGISFAWCVILSLMQGSANDKPSNDAHASGDKAMAASPLEPAFWSRIQAPRASFRGSASGSSSQPCSTSPSAAGPAAMVPAGAHDQASVGDLGDLPSWGPALMERQMLCCGGGAHGCRGPSLLPKHHPAAAFMRL